MSYRKGDDSAVPGSWQLFVDTGGTFTDAIAISPQGGVSRVKVLSSSALRGTIDKQHDARICRIATAWHVQADILAGGRFRLLTQPGYEVAVSSFDPSSPGIRQPISSR